MEKKDDIYRIVIEIDEERKKIFIICPVQGIREVDGVMIAGSRTGEDSKNYFVKHGSNKSIGFAMGWAYGLAKELASRGDPEGKDIDALYGEIAKEIAKTIPGEIYKIIEEERRITTEDLKEILSPKKTNKIHIDYPDDDEETVH